MNRKLMYGGIILGVSALSIGGTLMLMPEASDEVADGAVDAEVVDVGRAIYHNLRPAFVVNSTIENKSRNLQVDLVVMARTDAVIKGVIFHSPLIRNQILTFLADQDFQLLMTGEGKQMLRDELKELINSTLGAERVGGVVESVLYKNFVMQ